MHGLEIDMFLWLNKYPYLVLSVELPFHGVWKVWKCRCKLQWFSGLMVWRVGLFCMWHCSSDLQYLKMSQDNWFVNKVRFYITGVMYCFRTAQDRIFIHDVYCWMNCLSHGQFCLRYKDNAVSLRCVLHACGSILTHCLEYCLNGNSLDWQGMKCS